MRRLVRHPPYEDVHSHLYIIMKPSTLSLLIQRFGGPDVSLEAIRADYFGLDQGQAHRKAAEGTLPIPTYRTGTRKSPWRVDLADLAKLIDERRAEAHRHHIGMTYPT